MRACACDARDIVGVLIGFEHVRTHMHSKIHDDKFDAYGQLLTMIGAPGS